MAYFDFDVDNPISDYINGLVKEMNKNYDKRILDDIAELMETKYGLILNKKLFMQILKEYERRKKEKKKSKKQKVIYVCSKYKGNVKKNTKKAIAYCRMVHELGHIPIAPHLYIPRWLDDNDPDEREQGLKLGLRALKHCDEIWVFGDFISEGMLQEIEFAKANNIHIRHFCGEV